MKDSLITETSISIDATPAQVWKILTTPRLIKKYLMGTTVTTNWKVGSPITYEGEHEGKKYHDKGIIQKVEPLKIFQSTYLSSLSGKKDKPENYKLVTYKISSRHDKTVLTLTQDNNATEAEKEHSTENWKMTLKKMKEIAEHEALEEEKRLQNKAASTMSQEVPIFREAIEAPKTGSNTGAKIIGALLIILSIGLGYIGYCKVTNNTQNIDLLGLRIESSDEAGKQQGYIALGIAVLLLVSGIYSLNRNSIVTTIPDDAEM